MLGGNITAIFYLHSFFPAPRQSAQSRIVFWPVTCKASSVSNPPSVWWRTLSRSVLPQTKVPGLAAAVAGTTIAEEGSVVGGKDGCLRIVPYCPMKEPSSSNGMAENIGNS